MFPRIHHGNWIVFLLQLYFLWTTTLAQTASLLGSNGEPPNGKSPQAGKSQQADGSKQVRTHGDAKGTSSPNNASTSHNASTSQASPLLQASVAKIEKSLIRPCSVTMANSTLEQALRELASAFEFSFWIDRRIDLHRTIHLAPNPSTTLRDVLASLASQSQSAMVLIDEVVYFGPPSVIPALECNHWRLYQQFPTKARVAKKDLSWPYRSSPRDLAQSLADSQGLTVENPEAIEYDLWREGSLSCSMPARWTLLLAGFGLTAELDAKARTLQLIPLRDLKQVTGRYPANRLTRKQIEAWKSNWPEAKTQGGGDDEWKIQSPPLAQRLLLFPPTLNDKASRSPRSSGAKVEQFSGRIEGRLIDLLPALASKYQWQCDLASLPRDWQERVIKVEAKNLSAEQLMEQMGKSIGLTIELQSGVLSVRQ